jgi:hypothetical protein
MGKGDKILKVLNFLIIIFFLISPLLLAISYFLQSKVGLGMTFGGMFIITLYLYWRYGIDYFEVKWFKKTNSTKT